MNSSCLLTTVVVLLNSLQPAAQETAPDPNSLQPAPKETSPDFDTAVPLAKDLRTGAYTIETPWGDRAPVVAYTLSEDSLFVSDAFEIEGVKLQNEHGVHPCPTDHQRRIDFSGFPGDKVKLLIGIQHYRVHGDGSDASEIPQLILARLASPDADSQPQDIQEYKVRPQWQVSLLLGARPVQSYEEVIPGHDSELEARFSLTSDVRKALNGKLLSDVKVSLQTTYESRFLKSDLRISVSKVATAYSKLINDIRSETKKDDVFIYPVGGDVTSRTRKTGALRQQMAIRVVGGKDVSPEFIGTMIDRLLTLVQEASEGIAVSDTDIITLMLKDGLCVSGLMSNVTEWIKTTKDSSEDEIVKIRTDIEKENIRHKGKVGFFNIGIDGDTTVVLEEDHKTYAKTVKKNLQNFHEEIRGDLKTLTPISASEQKVTDLRRKFKAFYEESTDWRGVAPLDIVLAASAKTPFGSWLPLGSIVAWHKTWANTPELPYGWVECDGTLLKETAYTDSPYFGQQKPHLNVAKDHAAGRFLRGAKTSGDYQLGTLHYNRGDGRVPANNRWVLEGDGNKSEDSKVIHYAASSGFTTESRMFTFSKPVNMTVVWIIRVK